MELVNSTQGDAQLTQAVDRDGQPWLVVMCKATYRIEGDGLAPPRLAAVQAPLLASDVFEGEPGLSAPIEECDFAPFKPACDVLVKGQAQAPWHNGRPAQTAVQDVGLRVQGPDGATLLQKSIRVYGARRWRRRLGRWSLSDPEPFSERRVSYGAAFGGLHLQPPRGASASVRFSSQPMNLVGCGFGAGEFLNAMDGAPAHGSELWIDGQVRSVLRPDDDAAAPAAFGPVARNWQPRLAFAGTYDDAWRDEVFPLLPADFDERFHQCAPADQQMPHPRGGEVVTLAHLTRQAAQDFDHRGGLLSFLLPQREMPIKVLLRNRDAHELPVALDTVAIDADTMQFSVVWRGRLRLARSLHEVHTVAVGPTTLAWWRGRVYGDDGCAGCGDPRLAATLR
jgi:hypothetical protein